VIFLFELPRLVIEVKPTYVISQIAYCLFNQAVRWLLVAALYFRFGTSADAIIVCTTSPR